MTPGATAFTLMPSFAYSIASDLVAARGYCPRIKRHHVRAENAQAVCVGRFVGIAITFASWRPAAAEAGMNNVPPGGTVSPYRKATASS
jgi:hypothetical protein